MYGLARREGIVEAGEREAEHLTKGWQGGRACIVEAGVREAEEAYLGAALRVDHYALGVRGFGVG